MIPLHSIAEVVAATSAEPRDVDAAAVSSISIDSRDIAPGALFVAIAGETFDGHDFVAQAVEAGAVAALVGRDRAEGLAGLPLLVVPDALEGLVALARFSRSRSPARIVAVTGSVGKTSTKDGLRVGLSACGRTHASIKSFNNHWGVPLMLARMGVDARFGVFEIGMNHAGEIAPLSHLVRPHVAVITNVGPVHLEAFDSVEAIADAKAEIFSGMEAGGTVILGADHDHLDRLMARAAQAGVRPLTYGFSARADVRIADYRTTPEGGTAHVAGDGIDARISIAAPGPHAVSNAVGALLAARAAGGDVEAVLAALAHHGASEGRGAIALLGPRDNPLRLIDESYNANPVAMRAALGIFARMETGPGRKVLVLGDMLELGEAAGRYHRALAEPVLEGRPDVVFLVGDHMGALAEALPDGLVAVRTRTVEEIAQTVLQALAPGDSVMLKGSNGVRLGKLVAQISARFCAPN